MNLNKSSVIGIIREKTKQQLNNKNWILYGLWLKQFGKKVVKVTVRNK